MTLFKSIRDRSFAETKKQVWHVLGNYQKMRKICGFVAHFVGPKTDLGSKESCDAFRSKMRTIHTAAEASGRRRKAN